MTDFADRLGEIIRNGALPEHVREKAKLTLDQWNQGITPSQKTLDFLAQETVPPSDCARILHDGSCVWLRKYGEGYNLSVPPRGERAMCTFTESFTSCPGYKKMK